MDNEWSTDIQVIRSDEESQKKVKWATEKLAAQLDDQLPTRSPQDETDYAYFRGCMDMLMVLNGEMDIADMNRPFETE